MKKENLVLNGQELEVINLVPEFAKDDLAIVNLSVLKRITKHLKEASFESIKNRIMIDINNTENMEDLVATMEQELAFQKTVNVITTIKPDGEAESVSGEDTDLDYQLAP